MCEGLSAQGAGQQEEDGEKEHRELRRGEGDGSRRLWAFLLAWPIAQWCVTAGDAHRVELAGAELLVSRGSDKAGS